MALCFACHKEVGYLSMICGTWHHLKRNFIRKNLVVFDCPHCGTICQETAWSYYSFILVFMAVILLLVQLRWIDARSFSEWRYMVMIFVCYFINSFVWWKYVTQLKEPHIFWWE